MRPAIHKVKRKPKINMDIDKINSHGATPKGILIIIMMGEVKGIIDIQNAIDP